jgi:demethylmenaquinone methyltransferase / 2-methoxy-6-polyprenyl-1,4-benzoquinol methylase
LSAGLAAACGRVTALDVAADDFAVATRGRDHLDFVQGDATKLPFRDGTFGAVLAHSVLESGVEPTRLLAEAWRVLRPGGRLAVAPAAYAALTWCRAVARRPDR